MSEPDIAETRVEQLESALEALIAHCRRVHYDWDSPDKAEIDEAEKVLGRGVGMEPSV